MTFHQAALRRAEALMRAGNFGAAIEPLRDVLTALPGNAYAHHCLSRCLLAQRRLAGAEHEARLAIREEPLVGDYRLTLASALHLQQHGKRALTEVEAAIELAPRNPDAHLMRARFLRLEGKRAEAARSLDQALALAPNDPAVLSEVGYAALERGDLPAVEGAARTVLSLNPDDGDGLILIGWVKLAQNQAGEALRLALSALAQQPNDLEALSLLAAAKMKKSWVGGLWWRWNRFLVRLGQTRAIFVVVGIWVVYRWLTLASQDAGLPDGTGLLLTAIYLAFVLYTITADVIVAKMVRKELQRVRLRPTF